MFHHFCMLGRSFFNIVACSDAHFSSFLHARTLIFQHFCMLEHSFAQVSHLPSSHFSCTGCSFLMVSHTVQGCSSPHSSVHCSSPHCSSPHSLLRLTMLQPTSIAPALIHSSSLHALLQPSLLQPSFIARALIRQSIAPSLICSIGKSMPSATFSLTPQPSSQSWLSLVSRAIRRSNTCSFPFALTLKLMQCNGMTIAFHWHVNDTSEITLSPPAITRACNGRPQVGRLSPPRA